MLETSSRTPMTESEFAEVDALCGELRKRCVRVTCVTCGGWVPVVFDVRRQGSEAYRGPSLAEASSDRFRVVALRHERFCSFRCGMLFVQRRLRRDGPRARLAAAGLERRGR